MRVNRKGSAVAEDFAVLAVFNKHYNKWLMLADDFPEWKRKKAAEETVGGTAVTARRITNSATTKATTTSESGTGDNTGKGSSEKKKRKRNKKEEKYRLLLRMLIYDGEMNKFFEYTEVDIEKGNTQKEVFRLVELREVIDVIGKLVCTSTL